MNLVKHMVIYLIICFILGFNVMPILQSEANCNEIDDLTMARNEISKTGIVLPPDLQIKVDRFYYPTDCDDAHFVLRVRLSSIEYVDLLKQLQELDVYIAIEVSEDGFRRITGNKSFFENKYGIRFNEVTDIYRAWTRGKTRFTLTTLFIFSYESSEYFLTIIRV